MGISNQYEDEDKAMMAELRAEGVDLESYEMTAEQYAEEARAAAEDEEAWRLEVKLMEEESQAWSNLTKAVEELRDFGFGDDEILEQVESVMGMGA